MFIVHVPVHLISKSNHTMNVNETKIVWKITGWWRSVTFWPGGTVRSDPSPEKVQVLFRPSSRALSVYIELPALYKLKHRASELKTSNKIISVVGRQYELSLPCWLKQNHKITAISSFFKYKYYTCILIIFPISLFSHCTAPFFLSL